MILRDEEINNDLYHGIWNIILISCKQNKELDNAISLVKKATEEQDATETAITDSGAKWKVKRELDSTGNVIRHDSFTAGHILL